MNKIVAFLCLSLVGCSAHKAQTGLPTTHSVQNGETLVGIAIHYYGEDNKIEGIKAILKANPEMKTAESGPGIPTGSNILTIPELDKTSNESVHGPDTT